MRYIVLMLAGAVLGTLFDYTHVATDTTAYATPAYLGLAWWVPLLYAAAGLGIGLSHPQLDRLLGRPQRPLNPAILVLGLIALGALWSGSGLLPLPHWQRGLILAPAAMLVWWALDRTRAGLVLAALTAVLGCAVEILLSRLGLFVYINPDVAGIASWIPWIYVVASVAIGNLGRALAPTTLSRVANVGAARSGSSLTAHNDLVLGSKTETHNHGDVINVTVASAAEIMAVAREQRVDLVHYLTTLLEDVDHIDIRGITSRTAMREPIENLYTPLRSRDPRPQLEQHARAASEAEAEAERRIELPELLRRHPRLFLEGQPGAGKTTFLNLVACMLARDLVTPRPRSEPPWREEHLGLSRGDAASIPALVRLAELVRGLRQPGAEQQPSDRAWILRILAAKTRPADAADDHGRDTRHRQWDEWLSRGEAVLLLDGLDEVADERLRDRVYKIVRNACEHWRSSRVVVTSRPILTEAMTAAPLSFHKAVIDDLAPPEIERFIRQWSAALYSKAPQRGADSSRSLNDKIAGREELRDLARNPVMLTCLCVIHYNEHGELPSGRARVYRAIVRWMLGSREPQRNEQGHSCELAENALERLATAMMLGPPRRPGKIARIDFGDAAAAIDDEIRRYFPTVPDRQSRAELWLRQECQLSYLIEEVEGNQLRFWHLTIQEFLAAWVIAGRSDWWPEIEPRLDDPQWDKVVELLPGCLYERGGRDRVDELVRRIIDRGEHQGLAAEARVIATLGRALAPMSAYSYKEDLDLIARRQAIAARVMAIFTPAGADLPAKLRIAAAEVIGQWGDPRLADGVDNFLALPGTNLRLGKYPVTVAEYASFVRAGGYREERWWGEEGWAWKARLDRVSPWQWDDQQDHPNRPVTGVSWWEATAYANWLATIRHEAVRLPTAEEWERVAASPRGQYPWGEQDPTEELANFDKHIGAPTPVGVYPAGVGEHGHLDLAGNVWEWCADGPADDAETRWLKGGSWYQGRGALAAAYRFRYWRGPGGYDDIGFRVVVAREPLDP